MSWTRRLPLLAVSATLLFTASSAVAKEVAWHIKAIHPQGRTLDIKALDKDGHAYDVKAFETEGNLHVMDVKALVGGKRLPVKMLVSTDAFTPVKAIGEDGTIYAIKALTPEGKRLDVKGVSRSGNIIHIKAIAPDGSFYAVKAISPRGQLHDVKGIKMSSDETELTVNGVPVFAHIKVLPPTGYTAQDYLWHVRAVDREGRFLDVDAVDKQGNLYDVKAILDAGNLHVMDIKAFVGGRRLPVKILVSKDRYAPVKAIGDDGTIYDIKALTASGEKLDVKGVLRSGNIIHIKAIAPDGTFYGIKAVSPGGQLNDVKGVKMLQEDTELVLHGVAIHAHVKALPQVPGPSE